MEQVVKAELRFKTMSKDFKAQMALDLVRLKMGSVTSNLPRHSQSLELRWGVSAETEDFMCYC